MRMVALVATSHTCTHLSCTHCKAKDAIRARQAGLGSCSSEGSCNRVRNDTHVSQMKRDGANAACLLHQPFMFPMSVQGAPFKNTSAVTCTARDCACARNKMMHVTSSVASLLSIVSRGLLFEYCSHDCRRKCLLARALLYGRHFAVPKPRASCTRWQATSASCPFTPFSNSHNGLLTFLAHPSSGDENIGVLRVKLDAKYPATMTRHRPPPHPGLELCCQPLFSSIRSNRSSILWCACRCQIATTCVQWQMSSKCH